MNSMNLGAFLGVLAVLSCAFPSFADDTFSSGTSYSRKTVTNSSSNTSGASGSGSGSNSSGAAASESVNSQSSTSSSSSEVIEQSGMMGLKNSNKFVPNYKKRIETYKQQIALGLSKGWLSAADGDKYTQELARLTELETAVCAKNYLKPDLDDLDRQFTKFNMEFTNAGQKKSLGAATSGNESAGTVTKSAAPGAAKPAAQASTASNTKPGKKTNAPSPAKSATKPTSKAPTKSESKK